MLSPVYNQSHNPSAICPFCPQEPQHPESRHHEPIRQKSQCPSLEACVVVLFLVVVATVFVKTGLLCATARAVLELTL